LPYILNKDGFYYFNRKVPLFLKAYDPRYLVRFALHTDSRKEAIKLAIVHNETLEDYWRGLVRDKRQYCEDSFKTVTLQSRLSGFIATGEEGGTISPGIASAQGKRVSPTIQEGLTRYWGFAKDKTINKSPNQVRKWKNPRKLAVANLVQIIGDKPLNEVTREDMLKFKDWWIDRIQEENYAANSANKNFFALKTIFETVSDNLGLGLNIKFLFQKLKLEENWETKRRPFETDYIRNVLLNPENLTGLNDQARAALYAIAETGAGPAEQVGLEPENIHLDADIPYIEIVPGKNKALKTRYRKRTIPLVGFALDAFKAFPNGFDQYRDRPDQLSATLGKYLRENKLLPSENHTTYSLRHSFQDRLLAANAPDRLQADLMGHKFNRPLYGDGSTLAQKFEWLQKIQLR
jgi:site-specific recombinase XerD